MDVQMEGTTLLRMVDNSHQIHLKGRGRENLQQEVMKDVEEIDVMDTAPAPSVLAAVVQLCDNL